MCASCCSGPTHHSSSDSKPQYSELTQGSLISLEQYTLVLGDSWVREALHGITEQSWCGQLQRLETSPRGLGEASACKCRSLSSDPQNPHESSTGESVGDPDKKLEDGTV